MIRQSHHLVAPSASFPAPLRIRQTPVLSTLLKARVSYLQETASQIPVRKETPASGLHRQRAEHLSVDRLPQCHSSVLRSSEKAACVRVWHVFPIKQASVCRGSLLGGRGGLASEATRRMKTILIGLRREVFTTTILAVSFRWP